MERTGTLAHNPEASSNSANADAKVDAVPKRSGLASLFFFALAGAALGGTGLALRTCSPRKPVAVLSVDTSGAPTTVLLGESTEFPFTLTNTLANSDLEINEIRMSCGCTSLVEPISRVPKGSASTLWLRAEATDSGKTRVGSELGFFLSNEEVVKARFVAEVLAPFEGWPKSASATSDGNSLAVPVSSRYANRITSARAFHVDDNTEIHNVVVSSNPNRILIPDPGLRQIDLVVVFAPSIRWAGPLQVGVPPVRPQSDAAPF